MFSQPANDEQLRAENAALRARLEEAEEALRAIRAGEVDALVVEGEAGPQIFVLQCTDAASNRFRSDILAKVSDAIIASDDGGRVIYLNAAAERQYGVAAQEVLGRRLEELFENRWLSPADEAGAEKALREKGHWRGKNAHVKRNGEVIHVESAASRLLGKEGMPSGRLSVIRDITDQHAAEDAMRRNEALFSAIIEQAPGGVYVIDHEFRVCAMNALTRPIFAVVEPVIGRDFTEVMAALWGPELGPKFAAIFRHTLETGERYVSPGFTAPRHDIGAEQSYEWETQRLTLPNGRYGVVCYFTDVTERRRAEAALAASEARYRSIIDSSPDCIKVLDLEGNLLSMEAGQELLGITDLAPLLHKSWVEFWENPQDQAAARATVAAAAAGGEGHFVGFFRTRRGENKWWDVAISPMPGADGRPARLLAVSRDITERREMEEMLVARAAELAQADRSKDEFLAMLAHELRNPLAPLRNATALLQTPGTTAEERAHAQGILARQIENMSRMIDDLLDVSRITEGKIQLRRKPVPLEAILTAATSLARSTCAAQGQALAVKLPAEPVWLNADATRLEQVFGNLLGNACKYGGAGCHISLSAEVVDAPSISSTSSSSAGGEKDEGEGKGEQPRTPEVIVRVSDDGAGIDPELLPRIFDLFVQASRTLDRAHGGLGIGLTLVDRLVKLHGGTIEAHSQGLGHGAEFVVRLPMLSEAPPPAPPPPRVVREKSRRILIVDDNTDSARSLAMLQSRRGHVTRTAFTGPDAVTAAAEFLPEVMLLDIGLPGMDGFEVARRIRAMPGLDGVFLVAMTGYASHDDREEARLAGFDQHLVKPIDLETLRGWLQEMTPGPGESANRAAR